MENIPNRLECAYCIRNYRHGGPCEDPKFSDVGCLGFKLDPRGCIRTDIKNLAFPLYRDIPHLNEWSDGWEYNGVDTEIKITHIKRLTWNKRKGILIVTCYVDFFENEYHEDYKKPDEKPVLKVIK